MSKKPLVPEARAALDRIQTEFASEIDARFNEGNKSNGGSKDHMNGRVSGNMTKIMVEEFEKNLIDR